MSKPLHKRHLALIYGLIIILFAAVLGPLIIQTITRFERNHHVNQIQREIFNKQDFTKKLFDRIEQKSLDYIYCNFNEYLQFAQENNVLLYIYDKGQLALWSDNHVLPVTLNAIDNEPVIQRLPNGYYLQINRKYSFCSLVALIPVESAYPIENIYLKNEFILGEKGGYFRIYNKDQSTFEKYSIYSKKGTNLFTLSGIEKNRGKNIIILLFIIGISLIFFYSERQINLAQQAGKKIKPLLFFLVTLGAIIFFWKILKIPKIIFSETLFSPEIYASSHLFSSLGDLLISVLLITWLIKYLIKTVKFIPGKYRISHILFVVAGLSVTILITYFIALLIRGLVLNSNISFDLSDFYKFNKYSLISFFILFLIFYNFIRLTHFIFSLINKSIIGYFSWMIIITVTGIIFYYIFRFVVGIDPIILYFSLVIWLLYFFSDPLKKVQQNLNMILIYLLVIAAFNANLILDANYQKEIENRKHLITSIASEKDPFAEELLGDIVDKIAEDNYVKSYYDNPVISKTILKKRLKQLYFSGYLNQYDFNMYTFTAKGLQYKSHSALDSIHSFLDLIRQGQQADMSGNIFFINNYDGAPGYIVYLPVKHETELIGQLIIVLKQKPFITESFYPELLIEGNIRINENLKNYSYAIYKNNFLTNQKGQYPFPLTFAFDESFHSNFYTIKEKKYNHLVYKLNNQVIVVMTKKQSGVFNSLALFSLLFILSTLLIAVFFYLRVIFTNIKSQKRKGFLYIRALNPFTNLSFKFKIHLSSLLTILFALILTGYFTISFLKYNSKRNATTKLEEEIKTVMENLDSYFKENSIYKQDIYSRIKNIADQFKTDINLFDTDGDLITSSQMQLYERKIISNKMDAVAYSKLKILQNSQLIQNENIAGTITYLSAYGMIRDKSNNVVAFINIPYFSKEKEMNQEISSLIVTTINLYVFLFLLITLVSVFISNTIAVPLEIIRNHIAGLQLGRLNKKIEWKSSDEIGLLIEEYNKMLDKVEESADALARSERESAWREMAKQVAHEIKNPLTPMKLNIQQLIREWNDKAPNLDESFHKITRILINRIDSLSEIATEFSQFARMPEPDNSDLVIENVITDTAHLFSEGENTMVSILIRTANTVIWADEKQLSRAFNNLIKNAIQSIPSDKKGIIELETERVENNIVIMIRDNGCGIPEDIRDKIFLPNFSTKSSGMGLGLAIASRIINHANGVIWFETTENAGTTFYVSFPVTG